MLAIIITYSSAVAVVFEVQMGSKENTHIHIELVKCHL